MPPLDAFYYPSSMSYIERPGSEEGILLVANANFDKRYGQGSLVAVDLSALGEGALPAFGQKEEIPKHIRALNIRPENALKVSSFSGRMGLYSLPGGGTRFFLPSRSEGALLHVIDTDAPNADGVLNLRCFPKPEKNENDCTQTALSLTANERTQTGLPRAPSPGFAVVSEGEVWLTHMNAADSPSGSTKNHVSYAVRLSATEPQLTNEGFIPIGLSPSDTALPLKNWVLLTGRGEAPALRMLSKTETGKIEDAGIESSLKINEGRDLALSSDGRHIFLLGRYPDMLLVLRLDEPANPSSPPFLQVVREIPLPEAPNILHVLKRKGQGDDLVAILSSGSSALSFYDQEAGILTGQLTSLGEGPFSMASSMRGEGARLFIGNFSDGRIAVVDIVHLKRPQDAYVVAFLGKSQTCLIEGEDSAKCEEQGR
ncbi:MAG: hypothetical protein FWG75_01620 [Cystobacterineae bacterium]|nr:hypothetical protein [Cystobacterineae bacterium]